MKHGKCALIVVNEAPLFSILMNKPTVIFDPYAAPDLRNIVQTIVDNHNVASTGQADDPFTKNSDIASLGRLRIIRRDTSITS
jgi:hypothetical protein